VGCIIREAVMVMAGSYFPKGSCFPVTTVLTVLTFVFDELFLDPPALKRHGTARHTRNSSQNFAVPPIIVFTLFIPIIFSYDIIPRGEKTRSPIIAIFTPKIALTLKIKYFTCILKINSDNLLPS
jgi:hypothetical protein